MEKRIFVGRKTELDAFEKVLEEPAGQAVLVVGQAGMGKTWLVNEMAEIAENHPDLKCGWVRYEVTPTDSVDSTMALMMDNAFEAGQVTEGSFDGTGRRLEQWRSLLNVVNIGDLVMSLKRDPAKNTREQFLEKLRLISRRMRENGRAIFIIDPEKYMEEKSDQSWAIVVRDLPDKIKFVFAQRPEDALVDSETFRALSNVMRIPREYLGDLDKKEVEELFTRRAPDVGITVGELHKALGRYKGHPYALQAALDLLEVGTKVEDLPSDPSDIAGVQWKQICSIGPEAVRLFESYGVLGGSAPDYVIEQVGVSDSAMRKSLMSNDYISGLFREEPQGRRIYHAILREHVVCKVDEADRVIYVSGATRAILGSQKIGFFEKARFIGFLLQGGTICQKVADELHAGFKDDEALKCYFYEKNDYGDIPKCGWLKYLKNAGEFEELGRVGDRVSNSQWLKAKYLARVAGEVAEEVCCIIRTVRPENQQIQAFFVEATRNMPVEWIEKGVSLVKCFLDKRGHLIWYSLGENSAKLMVKLLDVKPELSYEIAALLLDLWRADEKEAGVFETIRSKFTAHEYKELIFKYYSKVWEKRPFEATCVLVEIYDEYLKASNKETGYDISEYLGVSVEDLENIERLKYDLDAIIMKAMCESGKAVIEKEPNKVSGLLDDLEGRNKGFFIRVTMYLLRFVPAGMEKDRINKIIADKNYLGEPGYKYEYKRLLNDKFDEVKEAKRVFENWVAGQKIDNMEDWEEWFGRVREREPRNEDKAKYVAGMKARELYLVRERFKKLYEEYKKASGLKDEELAPRRMVGEARFISPMEGTPLSAEEIGKKKVTEVLDYVLEPKNYERKKKADEWRDPVDALRATFKKDVKKRPMEYLKEGREKLPNLPPEFLSGFFYGVSEAGRDGSFGKEGWGDLIEFAHRVVQEKHKQEEYRNCFSAMLSTLRDGFTERENKIEFDEDRVKKFWEIIEPLVHFPIGDMSGLGEGRDPVQLSCNIVAGQAMELTVLISGVCKKEFRDLYEKYLTERRRKCYEYVLSEVRQVGVNYVFGLDFARIYWSDKEWVEEKIEDIFSDELWDETWGTYVSWGRPSPQSFKMLIEKGKYELAVEKIGTVNKYKFEKEPEEGLVEHLIIGFFNGWIGFEDDVLKAFFEKASAELRGKAARFMTTGFKSVNEEGGEKNEKAAARMKEYWEKRLAVIKGERQENKDEAIELTGWVEDSVLPGKETLELLEKTLDLSGGNIGKMRDARDFVEGVSKLGKGNELLALRCLKKAAADENMRMRWADLQELLVKFLETMVELPENIRSEAREVADSYGRYNPEKFRPVWEKLGGAKNRG